jgi:hypothetical protein
LGGLCISKGVDRGGNLGAGFILLGFPLIFVGGCSSLYGFLNLSFP